MNRHRRSEGKGKCKVCGTLLDNQRATICPECKIIRLEKATVILEAASNICHALSTFVAPEVSESDEWMRESGYNADGATGFEMRCANCGNTDPRSLWNEDDTIHCSVCHHRTSKATGEDDVVECPYCHRMRDRKAMYCRHCNDATWQPSTTEEFAEIDSILKGLEH